MKRRLFKGIRKMAGIVIGTGCFLIVCQNPVLAAGSVSVTADKTSASVSDTVTFKVQTSEPEDPATVPEITVTYDPDVLTFTGCDVEYGGGGGGLITLMGQTANITFSASATGEAGVSVEAIIDDDGNNPATGSANVTILASAQEELSSDATLKMIAVTPGNMTPEFSPQITDYTITVDESVTDITVSGGVSDDTAQITAASGFKNLKTGTNQAVITVTAADGSTLTYHFTIVREEKIQEETKEEETGEEKTQSETIKGEGLQVTVDEVSYMIQSTISEDILPDGCSKTTTTYNGQTVEAALFEAGGLVLLYAVADGGESGEFFICDSNNENLQIFVQLRSIENRFIVPIESVEGVPAGFAAEKMQWNNSYFPAYKLKDSSVKNGEYFYLVYAVNNEGEKEFYLYDTLEGTYQRFLNYTNAQVPVTTEKTDTKTIVIIGFLVIVLVAMIMIIVNLLIRNKELSSEMEDGRNFEKKAEKRQQKREQEKKKAETSVKQRVSQTPQPAVTPPEKPVVRNVVLPQETPMQPSDIIRTNTTGQIPRTVTQPPKTATGVKKAQVPIFTLDRQPVQLTREAPPDQLDDDFEFEFINIDNE